MPRGDWLNKPKTRLIFGLLTGIIFCASWISYGLLESAKYEWQAHDKSEEYSEDTANKVAETCVGIPRIKKIECLNQAYEAKREYEYNQRDLVAQKQSALWAYIMAAAAVIGMALSVVGVALVWTTFRETRKANRIAEKSQRAWVTMNVVGVRLRNTIDYASITFSVDVHNSGNSAATNVVAGYAFSRLGEDTVDFIDKVKLWDGSLNSDIERALGLSDLPPGISIRDDINIGVDYPLDESDKPKPMGVIVALKIGYDFVGGGQGRTVKTFWVGRKVQSGGGLGDFIPGRDDDGEVEIKGNSYRQIS